MAHIDYFYSLLSPFTYLAGDEPEQIAARHGATLSYRPADIMRVFAETGGVPVPKRHPTRQAYRLQELQRLPKFLGKPLNLHPAHWPTDVTRATLAVIAVDQAGGDAGPLSRAFLRACWAEERDIGDESTVRAILAETGCAPEAADMPNAARETYEANTAEALDRGVFGAPFFIVGEEMFWGQDRLPHLDWYLGTLED